MHKSLLVFRFFLAGHFRGAFYNGAFKGYFRLLGAFSLVSWVFNRGNKKSPAMGTLFSFGCCYSFPKLRLHPLKCFFVGANI